MLNKWVDFRLEDEIIYLNRTYVLFVIKQPALNAYFLDRKEVMITFESVKSHSKIEALFLIHG